MSETKLECTNCEATGQHEDFDRLGMDYRCPACGSSVRVVK